VLDVVLVLLISTGRVYACLSESYTYRVIHACYPDRQNPSCV